MITTLTERISDIFDCSEFISFLILGFGFLCILLFFGAFLFEVFYPKISSQTEKNYCKAEFWLIYPFLALSSLVAALGVFPDDQDKMIAAATFLMFISIWISEWLSILLLWIAKLLVSKIETITNSLFKFQGGRKQ